ncbi:PKD domain-containing protein [Christiangramia sediminis]|uniref:PKD domain-containing protein n=1 Tax=Christiangramia sediminis TaxID=2881336 RepID=A0A9X1RYN7_9FLAO|nr:PKD domain-containing protein [Christiangramia sediminis]MCB7482047.1 hypothetical protein [Christiangramia sediminis]
MKHIKKLLVLFLAFNVFTSCEKEEEVSYALQDVSAPTNVNAAFDISNDEEGTVTVTPTAEGATEFQIYFGDTENEEPVIVSPGETISHTYAEGEYNLRIVAIGLTGLTSELVRVVNISFGAPSELEVDITKSTANPLEIVVTPTAVDATVYDIYFGDVEDEEPTTIMDGESATHVYAEEGTYTVRVVARGGGAATVEYSEEVSVEAAAGPLKLPVTFDDPEASYAITPFGAAETAFEIVTNPELSGANATESMVGKISKAGAQYEGITFNLTEAVDLSGAEKTLTVKVYSETAYTVLLKLETGVNGERSNEVDAEHGGTGWEELSFNFATDATTSYLSTEDPGGAAIVPDGQYNAISLFLDLAGDATGDYYVDDLMKEGEGDSGELEIAENFPIGFEDGETLSGVFEAGQGVTGTPIANPDMTGNNSATVYEFTKAQGAAWYSGIFHIFPENIDLMTGRTFSFKIWSPKAGINVRMQLEKEGDDSVPNVFIDKTLSSANEWVTLTYDFTDVIAADATYDKFVVFPEYDEAAQPAGDGSVYYLDDFVQAEGDGGGAPVSSTTSFPVNFETPANGGSPENWRVFENADNPALEIISNPDMDINSSATVAKFTARTGGQPFAGTVTELETPFTLNASNSTVKIWVWKSVISDVGIKFENAAGGSTGEIKVANTKTNEWEELTFDFSGVVGDPNNTDITGLVIFPDFQARTSENIVYFDNVTLNAAGSTGGSDGGQTGDTFGLPIDFEADVTYTTGENSVPFEVVTNPEQSGINATATKVGKVTNGGGQYEALTLILDEAIDFSGSNKTITMKVYSETAYQVLFKLETGVNGERANEVEVSHGGTGWEELTFNFGSNARTSYISEADPGGAAFVPTGQYDEFSVFLDFAGFTAGEFYIDDIVQN